MKLGNITTWRVCQPGEGIPLPGPERRLIVELVGSGFVQMLHDTQLYPLGVLDGYLKVEVVVTGDVELLFDAEQAVLFRTKDQDDLGVIDGRYTESYTVMWERGPQQNPEFRRMMIIAQLRDDERQRQMDQAIAVIRDLQEKANANGIPAAGSPAAAPAGGAGAVAASAPDAAVSGGPAAGVAGAAGATSQPAGSPAGDAGSGVPQ